MNKPAATFTTVDPGRRLLRRHRRERLFRTLGVLALCFGAAALTALLYSVASSGFSAFWRTTLTLEIDLDPQVLGITVPPDAEMLAQANYQGVLKKALYTAFPQVRKRRDKRALAKLLSPGAEVQLHDYVLAHPEAIGGRISLEVAAASDLDQIHKGAAPREVAEKRRRLDDRQLAWYDSLKATGKVHSRFNWRFFSAADSRSPERAGIGGALVGSLYSLLVCFALSFPLGVAAAIYLEEFAPRNRLTDFIEANINNLAAVPSIIFGLLGLAVILNVFGLPRGTPLAGGVVLSLMTLPTIIIACRAALKSVPPSIREAAFGMGASPMQVVLHHVLPAALPGTLTGTIIGLAQALGETAPLLMIGMVAFIADIPATPLDPSASMPVQIYLWAESAERGFVEKTAAAIMVIMLFLVLMNLVAVILRSKLERRW